MGNILHSDDFSDLPDRGVSRADVENQFRDLDAFVRKVVLHRIRDVEADRSVLRMPRGEIRPDARFPQSPRAKLFFQLSGDNVFMSSDGETRIPPGTVCIIPAQYPHRERRVFHKGFFAFLYVMLELETVFYALHVPVPDSPASANPTAIRVTSKGELLVTLINALAETRMSDVSVAFQKGLLLALLGGLMDVLENVGQSWDANPLVIRCKQSIQRRLSDKQLSVAALATELRVNPDYLSRTFHQSEGMRLNRYINLHRIQLAKTLMAEGGLQMREVAHNAGFADPVYFARVFRRLAGCSPLEYRQRLVSSSDHRHLFPTSRSAPAK